MLAWLNQWNKLQTELEKAELVILTHMIRGRLPFILCTFILQSFNRYYLETSSSL